MSMTPEEMNEKIQSFHEAIQSEFDLADKADDPEKVKHAIRKKFMTAMLSLADDVIDIAHTSSSDAARMSAIKFATDFTFGAEKTPGGVGSLEEMLSQLK
jgi:hypothetical protein